MSSSIRSKLLAHSKSQLSVVGVNIFIGLISICIIIYKFLDVIHEIKGMSTVDQAAVDLLTANMLNTILLIFVISSCIAAILTLLLTHRMAGPMIRLKHYFQKIQETGQVKEKLCFRRDDYFSEVPDVINDSLNSLK